jgi:hypothetical protein
VSLIAERATVRRAGLVLRGFLVSLGVSVVAFIPVMVFTFLGLSSVYRIREANPLFASYFASVGLVPGLLLALVTNTIVAALILGLLHLVYFRPVLFYDPGHVDFARRLIVAGTGLFQLAWGERFFSDSYNDMQVLFAYRIGPGWFLSGLFIGSLLVFFAGLLYWARLVWPVNEMRRRSRPVEVVLSKPLE